MLASRPMDAPEFNVGIEPDLLAQAEKLGLSVAGMSEARLRVHLQKIDPAGAADRARRWAQENAEAIAEHNRFIEEHGLLSVHLRTW